MTHRFQKLNVNYRLWRKRHGRMITNNNSHQARNMAVGMAASLMTVGALGVFTAPKKAQAATGVSEDNKNIPSNFSDFPKSVEINETTPITAMAPYGAAPGNRQTLLGSKMETVSGGYHFLAFCMNYDRYGPETKTTYNKQKQLGQVVQKVRRVYLSTTGKNDYLSKTFHITDENDLYMVQQIAIWELSGDFSDYNPNDNGIWSTMTSHRISDERKENVRKAVNYIKAHANDSQEQPGKPVLNLPWLSQDSTAEPGADLPGGTSKADSNSAGSDNAASSSSGSGSGSSASSDSGWVSRRYYVDITKNYWFSNMTVKFQEDKLPAGLKGKVHVYYHNPDEGKGKDGNHELKANKDYKFGDGQKGALSNIGQFWIVLPANWKTNYGNFDVQDLVSFKANIDDYSPAVQYTTTVTKGGRALQDLAVMGSGGMSTSAGVDLKGAQSTTIITSGSASGKSTALDTDTGTQSMPTSGMDNVNLRDSFHLTSTDPNASYHVVSELIDQF